MKSSISNTAIVIVSLACLLVLGDIAMGGSIWAKRRENSERSASLYEDDKARAIGDVLTIVIKEKGTVETKKSRTDSKKTGNSGSGSGSVSFGDILGGLDFLGFGKAFQLPTWDFTSTGDSSLSGKADHKDEQTYTDNMTVVVEDVMPNGNLLVLGKRIREVSGNKQTIQASGIVRTSDIDATNTIHSDRVANFHIVYISRGPENNYLRDGWLMRIWHLLNPF